MRLTLRRRPADPGLVLARSLCHELRPPMATLAALLRALEEAPPEPRRSELARLAAEHVEYAGAVLSQAASTAYGHSVNAPAEPLRGVLSGFVEPKVSISASRAALKWPVHPAHTRQILTNLTGNAARHGAGPARLTAAVRARHLRLTVTDGGGPTPALQTALRRRTPPPDERGLGLWIVRQLLTSLGGTVRARPLSPAGLAMEVNLPRYPR
ncbi:ATP-binding protein [Actinoplanes sp. NPDC049596]|uniref:ATP-binding protein n=1 Tax=unclassified Actinoplanes TaxID=2626549 RepID=UPI00342861F3